MLKKAALLLILNFTFVCLFTRCRQQQSYHKFTRELDSLKVVTEQALDNFNSVDSARVYEACLKEKTYRIFIATHLKDTVSKAEAENLASFFLSEKPLHDYFTMRGQWLSEARDVIKQMGLLSNDLKNGSVESEEAIEFIGHEKKRSEKLIEELKYNTLLVRKHLELYARHLPSVENMVKEQNAGVLPVSVNPKNEH